MPDSPRRNITPSPPALLRQFMPDRAERNTPVTSDEEMVEDGVSSAVISMSLPLNVTPSPPANIHPNYRPQFAGWHRPSPTTSEEEATADRNGPAHAIYPENAVGTQHRQRSGVPWMATHRGIRYPVKSGPRLEGVEREERYCTPFMLSTHFCATVCVSTEGGPRFGTEDSECAFVTNQ